MSQTPQLLQNSFSADGVPGQSYKWDVTLTPVMRGILLPALEKQFELAMLAAQRDDLPGGGIRLRFDLSSDDTEIMNQAFLIAYTKHSGFLTEN